MVQTLSLRERVQPRPLDEWGSVSVELLGTQTRIVQGKKYYHRVIECGTSGEPLILIHGIGGHAETYARNLHNLAKHFHVYAIDALYHGFSQKDPWDPDHWTEIQAEGLADLIQALGYSWAHVEGESMGGLITWEFGLRFPEMAGKLVMNTGLPNVNTKRKDFVENPGGGPALMELSQRSILEPRFETVRARMEWLVAKPERMTDEMVNIRIKLYSFPEIFESMKRVYRIGGSWDNFLKSYEEEDLQAFKPDSLVFWTQNNPGQGPDSAEYIANLIPGAKFYNMQDAAHWPQWEKPEEHDQVLIDFIKG